MSLQPLVTNSEPHPKKATAKHHMTRWVYPGRIPSRPSSSGVIIPKAGIIPTSPAANGIVPVATAVVCKMTFSCGVNGAWKKRGKRAGSTRKIANPSRADCKDIIDTQPVRQSSRLSWISESRQSASRCVPVCSPKYMLVIHKTTLLLARDLFL
jgi:hypothetical protein